jgi:hypothetical protein
VTRYVSRQDTESHPLRTRVRRHPHEPLRTVPDQGLRFAVIRD